MKMHHPITAAVFGLTLGAASLGPALAQDDSRGPVASDANIRTARNTVDRLVDQLQNDNHDYGGFRVAAIKDLQAAHNDLQTALAKDGMNPNESQMQGGPNAPHDASMDDPNSRNDNPSDRNIAHVGDRVSTVIDQLQNDKQDYHGYRIAAIKDLQRARNDLQQAASHDTSDNANH